MKRLVKESIEKLDPYQPGKPIEELEREYGITGAIKLASNENPLGPSPKALEVIKASLNTLHRYPDAHGFYLREKLSHRLRVGMDSIVLGNGSDEIIQLIAQAFLFPGDEAMMSDPAFAFYQIAVGAAGGDSVKVPLKNFSYDLPSMASAITQKTKLIFINNPLNPTGTIVTRAAWESFLERVPSEVIVIVDEAYGEYVTDASFPNTLEYLGKGRKIFILRTFSKIYGLAGLRIGYAVSQPELIKYLNKIRGPFNVNSLAQAAALAALDDDAHLQRSLTNNQEGLAFLYAGLETLGVDYLPTQANFFLVNIGKNASQVYEALLAEGVIVRTLAEYGFQHYLRITVGLPSENERLIQSLRTVLAQG